MIQQILMAIHTGRTFRKKDFSGLGDREKVIFELKMLYLRRGIDENPTTD